MDNKSYKVERKKKVMAKKGGCDRCPCHGGENAVKKPRPDKYKNKR